MKLLSRKKKSSSAPLTAALIGAAAFLLAAGAWYLWFRPDSELSDEEMSEIQAFDEYERQKTR